jgi:hypothetical protein
VWDVCDNQILSMSRVDVSVTQSGARIPYVRVAIAMAPVDRALASVLL